MQSATKAPPSFTATALLARWGSGSGGRQQTAPLPHVTLRIRRLIVDAQSVAERLEQIAFDGVIDDTERADFENALSFLRQLEKGINDIILCGLENEKATPGATGVASR